jgi:hypothetical protein
MTQPDVQGSVHRECIFKYNQQDATLHNLFVSAKYSICFRRFLRPSSGAQKLYIQHLVFVKLLLLPFALVGELKLHFAEINELCKSCILLVTLENKCKINTFMT